MQSTMRKCNEQTLLENYVHLLYRLKNYIDKNEGTAIISRLEEVIQLQDINYKMSSNGNTVLHVAAAGYKWAYISSFAQFLIDRGADPTITNCKGQTIVHSIISRAKYKLSNLSTEDSQCINLMLSMIHIKKKITTTFPDIYGFSHFHAACMINDQEVIEFFLNNGACIDETVNMDSPNFPGCTPLHFASQFGHVRLANKLLSHGANLLKNLSGMTALHELVKRNVNIMQLVHFHRFAECELEELRSCCMQNKEDLLIEFSNNEKIISSSLAQKNKTIIESIGLLPFYVMCKLEDVSLNDINKQIDVDSSFCPGYTALHFAARFSIDTVKSLIKKRGDIEVKDVNGVTPFDLCVGRYSVENIHYIISSHNVWKNIVLSDGQTKLPELVFSMRDPQEFGKFLASIKQSINDISLPNDSPLWPGFNILHLAVVLTKKSMHHRLTAHRSLSYDLFKRPPNELIKLCLRSGADVVVQDRDGMTPIHLAFYRTDLDNLHLLLKHFEGNSNPTDKNNLSLLHIACLMTNIDLVKKLVVNGANVNETISLSFKWEAEVQCYYELDSTMHFFMWPGSTPLHAAVTSCNKKLIKLLMKVGAKLNAKDANGLTPLHRQITQKHSDDIFDDRLLSQFISTDSVVDGLSYLHVAARNKYRKSVEKLLKLGADVNSTIVARDNRVDFKLSFDHQHGVRTTKLTQFFSEFAGDTPLHVALDNRIWEDDAAQALMSRGANVLAKNSRGISPIGKILKVPERVSSERLLRHYMSLMNSEEEKRLTNEMHGLTKLHLACCLCDLEIIRACLKSGANANARIHDDSDIWPGYTPLHLVVKFYEPRVSDKYRRQHEEQICKSLRLLLKYRAELMITDTNGDTPLMLNIQENYIISRPRHIDMLWEELKNKSLNPVNHQGISHFHLACIKHDLAMVERFLKLGVDVNQRVDYLSSDYAAYTPLHFAVCSEMPVSLHYDSAIVKTVNILLKYGANLQAMDLFNKTPFQLAGPELKRELSLLVNDCCSN